MYVYIKICMYHMPNESQQKPNLVYTSWYTIVPRIYQYLVRFLSLLSMPIFSRQYEITLEKCKI